MKTVLLFGGTGNLGKKIAAELQSSHYSVSAVVRNQQKADEIAGLVHRTIIADATNPLSLQNCCNDADVVISALGKPVSLTDRSRESFADVDLDANSHILKEAIRSGVKKFVYVSAFHAEKYLHLEYFRVHHEFSERLKKSGIDYSILKPPALFSAFIDLMEMAKKGRLLTMGKGDKLTNPIYDGDLAKLCVKAIDKPFATIEAGGKEVLSRKQINELIQQLVEPAKKVRSVPFGMIKALLPMLKLLSGNMYDKVAFFTEVMQHDTIAPKIGEMKLEDYVKMKLAP